MCFFVVVHRRENSSLAHRQIHFTHLFISFFLCRRYGTKCSGCGQGIAPSDLVRKPRDKVFHLNCFTCCICRKQLSTGEQLYVLDDNKFICKDDYMLGKGHHMTGERSISLFLLPNIMRRTDFNLRPSIVAVRCCVVLSIIKKEKITAFFRRASSSLRFMAVCGPHLFQRIKVVTFIFTIHNISLSTKRANKFYSIIKTILFFDDKSWGIFNCAVLQ